jgi:hypothetical protein
MISCLSPVIIGDVVTNGKILTVDNIVALKALSVDANSNKATILVLGYYTAGDNGGGVFYYDANSSDTANNGTIVAPDSNVGRWIRVYEGAINVRWFGAGGQALTDDTAAIQAAINYAASLSKRGTVYLPAGEYVISSTLTLGTSGVSIFGDSMWKTLIRRSLNFGDTFYITGNDATGVTINDVSVRDIGIRNEGLMTSGAHMHLNGLFRGNFRNISLKDGYEGFSCQALTSTAIDNINIVFDNNFTGTDTGRKYMLVSAGAPAYAHPACGDLFVSNFNFRNGSFSGITQIGVYISAADGVWFSNGHIGGASGANLTIVNAGDQLTLIFFDNVMFHATAFGSGIQFSNCYLAGADSIENGVNFGSGTDFYGVLFSNTTITGHTNNGVLINSVDLRAISFDNCCVRGNSRNPVSTGDGYRLEANVSNVSITGGKSGGPEGGGSNTQAYGIRVSAGTGNNILVKGVDVTGNTVAGITSAATGDNVHFEACYDGSTNSVASASTITLPFGQPLVNVTGTTTINTITAAGFGTKVTLVFAGALTVTDGSNLKLAGNFVSTADDTLSLISDGTNWIEVSRSVN